MTTNIQVAGTDLSALLAPIGSFTPIAATGIQSGGTDLANIFAGASHGTAYGTTNIKSNGTDIGTLFAKLGSTLGSVVIDLGKLGTAYGYSSVSGYGSLVSSSISFGSTVIELASNTANAILFGVTNASNPGKSVFTTMTVSGTGVSFSVSSASATYSYTGTTALWQWTGSDPFSSGTVGDHYTATFS